MEIKFDIDRIYDLLINNEGFTLKAETMEVELNKGFVIAIDKKYEIIFPSVVFERPEIQVKQLLNEILISYYLRWFTSVKTIVKGVVNIGMWYSEGSYYLDYSEIELDRQLAMYKGLQRGQRAIYDLEEGKTIWLDRMPQSNIRFLRPRESTLVF